MNRQAIEKLVSIATHVFRCQHCCYTFVCQFSDVEVFEEHLLPGQDWKPVPHPPAQ